MTKRFKRPIAFLLAVIMAMALNLPSGTSGTFDFVKTANAADTITYTALEGTAGYSNEGYEKLVDGDTSTKWCCRFSSSTGAYIVFKSSVAGNVEGYTMTTGNDTASNTSRNPEDWTLYGCNDYTTTGTGTWEVIHKVTGDSVLQNTNKTPYHFDCDLTAKKYQYFKLYITKNSGSEANIQLAEFSLDLVTCEHDWVFSSSTEADCITPAYDFYTCSLCGGEKKEKTSEALGHTFVVKESHAPSCLTEGYVIEECSVCHVEQRVKTSDPLGHDFNDEGVCNVCGASDTAVSKPINGDGTSDNPYLISTRGELYWFAGLVNGTLEDVTQNKSAHAKLAADITVVKELLNDDGTIKSTAITEWEPIGSSSNRYTGTFDGNGHTISGLYCVEGDYVGLFGYIGNGGKVINTSVVDSYFSGNKYVGSICGYNYCGIVEYCYADTTLKGLVTDTYIGGIGYNYSSSSTYYIKNCLAAVSIAKGSLGKHYGIGYNATNKYYVIKNNPDEIIFNSSVIFEESEESLNNGKLTYLINGSSSADTVVWRQDLSAENSRPVPDGASENPSPIVYYKCLNTCAPVYTNSTEEASQTEHSYTDGICTNGCGVPEMSGSYYLIYNKEQLLTFAEYAKACSDSNYINAKLMADIDLSSIDNWKPIGDSSNGYYSGNFDGNGHTISGIRCIGNYAGLFYNNRDLYQRCSIRNLNIVDSYFEGSEYCGVVAALTYWGTVQNCYTDATIIGTQSSTKVSGISYNLFDLSNIKNCFANVNIGENSLGTHYATGMQKIHNCYYRVKSNPSDVTINKAYASIATDEDLASGKITYLLNNKSSSSSVVWRQTIGQDALPCIDANKPIVYAAYNNTCIPTYTNDSALEGYSSTPVHSYIDGICEYGCGVPEKVDGVYQLYNAAQFITFADYCKDCSSSNNVNGRLMADIDLSSVENWRPIGNADNNYYGSFDGDGHTISGINCVNSEASLFNLTYGTIENLCITDSYFEGDEYVAPIAAHGWRTIQNCRVEATLKGTSSNAYVCGISLVGAPSYPAKNNLAIISIAEGSVGKKYYGTNDRCVLNSYYMVAENVPSAAITLTDAVEVDSEDLASGKITYLLNDSIADETSVWRQDLGAEGSLPVPDSTGPIVYGKYDNSCTASVYTNSVDLDGYSNNPTHNYVDGVCQNGCAEPIKEDDTYLIYNADQLLRFAEYIKEDKTINGKLMADIDLSAISNWMPMGNFLDQYYGCFDGNGYAIRGMTTISSYYSGLFYYNYGTIKNLSVVDSYSEASWYASGIAGYNYGTIDNCYTDITLKGYGTSSPKLCGITYCSTSSSSSSSVNNCFSRVTIASNSKGAVYPVSNSKLTNSYYIIAENNAGATINETDAAAVSSDDLASGKVTYLLNGSSSDAAVVWRQDLSAENSRPNPDSRDKIVYFGNESYYNAVLGDVNNDDVIDKIDAALVLKYVSGITTSLNNTYVADYNGDGTVDMLDVVALLKAISSEQANQSNTAA